MMPVRITAYMYSVSLLYEGRGSPSLYFSQEEQREMFMQQGFM